MVQVALDSTPTGTTDPSLDLVADGVREELRCIRVALSADVAVAFTTEATTRHDGSMRAFLVEGDGTSFGLTAGIDMATSDCPVTASPNSPTVATSPRRVWIASALHAVPQIVVLAVRSDDTPVLDAATRATVLAATDRCARHLAHASVFDLTKERTKRVQRVLDDELFLMVFQPIVELHTRATAALEAFSRFPAEPVRPPQDWFSEAADVGLGVALEVAALRHALHYLGDVPAHAPLAVNLSAATATSRHCLQALGEMPLGRLVLELDGFGDDDGERLARTLAPLRERGLRIAMHELRDGAFHLDRFFALRPDIVKLDASIVDRIDSEASARAVVKAALAVLHTEVDGRGPRTRVVACHVERRAQLDTLALLGVDWGQGYYLGRPAHVRVSRENLSNPTAVAQP